MGMGFTWLAVSMILSILSLLCGMFFMRREKRQRDELKARSH